MMKQQCSILIDLLFINLIMVSTNRAMPLKDDSLRINKLLKSDSLKSKTKVTILNDQINKLNTTEHNINKDNVISNNITADNNTEVRTLSSYTVNVIVKNSFEKANSSNILNSQTTADVMAKTKSVEIKTDEEMIAETDREDTVVDNGLGKEIGTKYSAVVDDLTYTGVKTGRIAKQPIGDEALKYSESPGAEQEEPTSRIVVSVMKRSGRYWEPWELNNNICPPSLCRASDETRPRGTGGSVFYNGDIVLDPETEEQIYGNSLRVRWKRAATRSTKRLWKNGIVPYTFSDILPQSKKFIRKAMKHIQKHTCIRFRQKKLRDEDYIRFISEPGCWSMVGRVGGEQKVSIGRGCERLGTAIHEISHALGFWHEQARPDRDKYVKILEKNISPRYLPDFTPANKSLVSSRGFPYDYESVMHYSEKAFTNLGEKTIEVIGIGKKLKMKIGQRDALSNLDIAQLREMYKCNDKEDDNVTYCPSGWKKYGRSCYKFVSDLKYQFAAAARHCESLNSHLLYIENSKEDTFIKRRLKKKYPNVAVWRTGGRKVEKGFVWYTGDGRKPKAMDYTKWRKGHPASFSSMALVHNKTANRIRWEGVWLGSAKQYPEHAYSFICERRARRKCIKGKYHDGRDYRGKLDHTVEGITCQKWSSQYPQSHKLLPYPYKDNTNTDPDGLGDHNYCRNPSKDRKRRPWCFTDKKKYKWQYCDISICSKSSNTNKDKTIALNAKYSMAQKNKNDNSIDTNAGKNRGANEKRDKYNEIQGDQNVKKVSNKMSSDKNRKGTTDKLKGTIDNRKGSTDKSKGTSNKNNNREVRTNTKERQTSAQKGTQSSNRRNSLRGGTVNKVRTSGTNNRNVYPNSNRNVRRHS